MPFVNNNYFKEQAKSGLIWSFIERFGTQGISFVLSLVIARKLAPSDYGMIAMLSVFLAISQTFIDSGFSNALIQKQNRSENDCTTVFFFSLLTSIICYCILVVLSPFISSFYKEPQLSLILHYSGLILIINAIVTVPRAILLINLEFKKIAYISVVSIIISGIIAIIMAYLGYGVWTLVAQTLISGIISTLLIAFSVKWIPKGRFSNKSFCELFSFSSKLLGSRILHTIYLNLYTIIVGRFFNSYSLGLYNRASTLSTFATTNLTSVVQKVAFSIECKLQDDDKELVKTFISFLRMTCFLTMPLSIGLCVLSEPLIRLLLTDKWIECVPYLRILCFAYFLYPLMCLNYDVLIAKHRSDFAFISEVKKKIVGIVILILSLPLGLTIMCYGLIVYQFFDIWIITSYTKKISPQLSLTSELVKVLPIAICSAGMGFCVLLLCICIPATWMSLLLYIVAGIITYMVMTCFFVKEEFFTILNFLKKWKY